MSDKSKTRQTPDGKTERTQSKKRAGGSSRMADAAAGASMKAAARAAAVSLPDAGMTSAVGRVGPRPATKKDQLVVLLSTEAGVDVATLSTTLGWQMHTTRAALTGLRKAGHVLEASRPAGHASSTYRIVPGVTPANGAT